MKFVHQIGFSLEELRAEAAGVTPDRRASYAAWLASRPMVVRELAARFDIFVPYRVKEGAPHGTTGPGTIGTIIGFTEDGMCIFLAHVLHFDPEHMVPALDRVLAIDAPFRVNIAPDWLEPIPPEVS